MILFGILIYLLIGYIVMRLIVYFDVDDAKKYFRDELCKFLLFVFTWIICVPIVLIGLLSDRVDLSRIANKFMGIKDE